MRSLPATAVRGGRRSGIVGGWTSCGGLNDRTRWPTGPKIYVKACINGARTPDQHPNLPVTPEQLAAAGVAAHQAGAKAVHMHPKTADGVDSLLPDVVDAAVSAVRSGAGAAARA